MRWLGKSWWVGRRHNHHNQPVANLVFDLFDGNSKNLLWRGLATEDLSNERNREDQVSGQ